jgi:hypothetical protein
MARQADLVPRAGSGARSSSKARNPDGSVPAIDIDVDYLVFTTVITNTCPNRRTSSAPLLALASITAHGRHSRASDDHHHHPCFARAAPPHAPWSKREVLHPSGCRSRGHPPAQGPTGQLRRPCSLVVRPQGVDSPNRSPVATSTAANSVEAGSRALGRSRLGPGQSSVAPEATDPDLLGGHMTTRSRTGAAHRLGVPCRLHICRSLCPVGAGDACARVWEASGRARRCGRPANCGGLRQPVRDRGRCGRPVPGWPSRRR